MKRWQLREQLFWKLITWLLVWSSELQSSDVRDKVQVLADSINAYSEAPE